MNSTDTGPEIPVHHCPSEIYGRKGPHAGFQPKSKPAEGHRGPHGVSLGMGQDPLLTGQQGKDGKLNEGRQKRLEDLLPLLREAVSAPVLLRTLLWVSPPRLMCAPTYDG